MAEHCGMYTKLDGAIPCNSFKKSQTKSMFLIFYDSFMLNQFEGKYQMQMADSGWWWDFRIFALLLPGSRSTVDISMLSERHCSSRFNS